MAQLGCRRTKSSIQRSKGPSLLWRPEPRRPFVWRGRTRSAPGIFGSTVQGGVYVFTRMDSCRRCCWLGGRKSFSREWLRSVYGHAHGCWRRSGRRILDTRRWHRRLPGSDRYNHGCRDWCSASDGACRLRERQKDLRPPALRISAEQNVRAFRLLLAGRGGEHSHRDVTTKHYAAQILRFTNRRERHENDTHFDSLFCCFASFGATASCAGSFQVSALYPRNELEQSAGAYRPKDGRCEVDSWPSSAGSRSNLVAAKPPR